MLFVTSFHLTRHYLFEFSTHLSFLCRFCRRMFGISLIFLMAFVARAACTIAFNGGDAQWNSNTATGNTIEITSPLTYTIEANGDWRGFVFDEAVTPGLAPDAVTCGALEVRDCFIEIDSLTFSTTV